MGANSKLQARMNGDILNITFTGHRLVSLTTMTATPEIVIFYMTPEDKEALIAALKSGEE